MLVDRQLHALGPPGNNGSAAEVAVVWALPDPSAFDAIVESPGAALPRGHDIPSGAPQKASPQGSARCVRRRPGARRGSPYGAVCGRGAAGGHHTATRVSRARRPAPVRAVWAVWAGDAYTARCRCRVIPHIGSCRCVYAAGGRRRIALSSHVSTSAQLPRQRARIAFRRLAEASALSTWSLRMSLTVLESSFFSIGSIGASKALHEHLPACRTEPLVMILRRGSHFVGAFLLPPVSLRPCRYGTVWLWATPVPPGGNIGRGGCRRRSVRQVWRDGRRFLGKPAPRDSPAAFVANSLFFQKQIQIELFLAA